MPFLKRHFPRKRSEISLSLMLILPLIRTVNSDPSKPMSPSCNVFLLKARKCDYSEEKQDHKEDKQLDNGPGLLPGALRKVPKAMDAKSKETIWR